MVLFREQWSLFKQCIVIVVEIRSAKMLKNVYGCLLRSRKTLYYFNLRDNVRKKHTVHLFTRKDNEQSYHDSRNSRNNVH